MKKVLNAIFVFLFGAIPFKSKYEYKPPKEKNKHTLLNLNIHKISNDSRAFKNYL